MAKEVTRGIKVPAPKTYTLYDLFMKLTKKEDQPVIFQNKESGVVLVKREREGSVFQDLLFYRFAHHDSPIAMITHHGESMTMLTYELGGTNERVVIREVNVYNYLWEAYFIHKPIVPPAAFKDRISSKDLIHHLNQG